MLVEFNLPVDEMNNPAIFCEDHPDVHNMQPFPPHPPAPQLLHSKKTSDNNIIYSNAFACIHSIA